MKKILILCLFFFLSFTLQAEETTKPTGILIVEKIISFLEVIIWPAIVLILTVMFRKQLQSIKLPGGIEVELKEKEIEPLNDEVDGLEEEVDKLKKEVIELKTELEEQKKGNDREGIKSKAMENAGTEKTEQEIKEEIKKFLGKKMGRWRTLRRLGRIVGIKEEEIEGIIEKEQFLEFSENMFGRKIVRYKKD